MSASRTLGVIHVIAPVMFGGGEALLIDMLSSTRPDLDEAVITIGRASSFEAGLLKHGIACDSLTSDEVGTERSGRLKEVLRGVPVIPRLARHLRAAAPDVVHAHGFPPSLLVAAASARPTVRVYTHHYERRRPGRLEAFGLTRMFNRYDALTAPADHLAERMNEFFPRTHQRFQTLRIGLADRFFDAAPDLRWREMFESDVVVGVSVGRLIATKNQMLIVDSLAAMPPSDRSRLGVVIVGSGPQEQEIRARITAAGLEAQIRLVGQVDRADMPALLAGVDFGIFPTLTEASSVAAAEVVAAGRPLLALDIPSMRETGGAAAIYAMPDSFGLQLLEMVRNHRSLAARAVVHREALRVHMVRAHWAALYRQLVGQAI